MIDCEHTTGPPPDWLRDELHDFWLLDTERLLACLILGEAESEPWLGKLAVACVARNRVYKPGWWGDDYHSVILKSSQFSCFNRDSPRIKPMRDPEDLSAWPECLDAARAVLNGCADVTRGANHYVEQASAKHTGWAIGRDRICTIGNYAFYRL